MNKQERKTKNTKTHNFKYYDKERKVYKGGLFGYINFIPSFFIYLTILIYMKCVICGKRDGKPYFCDECYNALNYLKENIELR